MDRTCIAIVDATRARLFTFDREVDASGPHEELVEHTDLVNPTRRLRPSDLFSNSGHEAGFDDHRGAHMEGYDAAFARQVIDQLEGLVRSAPTRRLIVCASPKMLGALRIAELRELGIVIDEIDRDLVKLTPPELREYLATAGMLPAPAPRN